MPETREPFHVLAGEPVPVTDLDGIYTLMCELGIVVTRGYRCVLYAWAESEGRWTWRPVAGASTGRGVDPSRAAKSLIAKAGATGKAGLYHVERNPTRSMVKYEIDAVAVFPFTIRTNAEERRFVLYLDVLAGETLDEDRVEQLGKVLESLLSLGGGILGAPLGWLLIKAASLLVQLGWLSVSIDPVLYLQAVGVATGIGLIGSAYPAVRAA